MHIKVTGMDFSCFIFKIECVRGPCTDLYDYALGTHSMLAPSMILVHITYATVDIYMKLGFIERFFLFPEDLK